MTLAFIWWRLPSCNTREYGLKLPPNQAEMWKIRKD